jgi:aminopeptidase N
MLRRELRDAYLKEDRESYRRPIACRTYRDPIELFDAHLYQKGAWVLGMLRHELGDVLFWRALSAYIRDNRGGSVETHDLRHAVEVVSGRNFEKFFEQWIERAGYPELKVETSWDSDRSELAVHVEQEQGGTETPEVFELTLPLAFLVEGQWRSARAEINRRQQGFTFGLPAEPEAVVIDPEERILATVAWKRPVKALATVLARAPWAPARAQAAEALGRLGSTEAVRALERALATDAFWGVRAAAAEALGEARTDGAFQVLLSNLGVLHPKARRAVVAALGSFRREEAARALRKLLQSGDSSYFVEAEAARSLGKTRRPEALAVLEAALGRKQRTWNETVRCGALDGLGWLGVDDREAAVKAILPWTDDHRFVRCRQAAVKSLARIGAGNDRVRERLEDLLEDPEFRVAMAAAEALGDLGSRKSVSALSRLSDVALDGRLARTARQSMRRLTEGAEAGIRGVRAQVEEIASDVRALRDRVDRLESRPERAATRKP